MNRVYFNNDSPRIIRVNKLANSIHLRFETEAEANTVRGLHITEDDIWNTAFQGLRVHEPMYGIVVHDVPVVDLNPENMEDKSRIKRLERENNMKAGKITKITSLRRKKNYNSEKVKLHHSIVGYLLE